VERKNPVPGATGNGAGIDTDEQNLYVRPAPNIQGDTVSKGRLPSDLDPALAAFFKYERAAAAARRFISRNKDAVLRRSAVVEFLRRRRDPLSPEDAERCATEALQRWMSSRANRYRKPR
jgi:hypothetical protein